MLHTRHLEKNKKEETKEKKNETLPSKLQQVGIQHLLNQRCMSIFKKKYNLKMKGNPIVVFHEVNRNSETRIVLKRQNMDAAASCFYKFMSTSSNFKC